MKFLMYCVYDKVGRVYSNPCVALNTQDVLRSYDNLCRNNPNKEDFSLFFIGYWDNSNGNLVSLDLKDILKSFPNDFFVNENDKEKLDDFLYSELKERANE